MATKGGIITQARMRGREATSPVGRIKQSPDPDAVEAFVAKSKAALKARLERRQRGKN
jgi:hypothetical protein